MIPKSKIFLLALEATIVGKSMDQGFAGWIHVVGVGGFPGFLYVVGDDDDEKIRWPLKGGQQVVGF